MKLPPYVQSFPDKTGTMRFYLRKKGLPRVALPNPAKGKAAFVDAYTKALGAVPSPLRKTEDGTMDALVNEYLKSPEYKALRPNSKAVYNYAIAYLRSQEQIMASPIRLVKRRNIYTLRDRLAEDTPGKANMVLKVVRRLFTFGVQRELCDFNPAAKVEALEGGEYRSWTDDELAKFEARWPRGTTQRLVYELALGTGQRRGDIAKMTWADIKDGVVYVCQEKTGEKVWVPAHASLVDELVAASKRHAVVVSSVSGRSFTPAYLGIMFAKAIDKAGLPDACVLHGLRKAATRRLAEAGCSDREIMAITGHRTPQMVTHYTKDADRKVMAISAMKRSENAPVSNAVKPAQKS